MECLEHGSAIGPDRIHGIDDGDRLVIVSCNRGYGP